MVAVASASGSARSAAMKLSAETTIASPRTTCSAGALARISPAAPPPGRPAAPQQALYARRKQTIEPVFGITKGAMGFLRFHIRGLRKSPPNGL